MNVNNIGKIKDTEGTKEKLTNLSLLNFTVHLALYHSLELEEVILLIIFLINPVNYFGLSQGMILIRPMRGTLIWAP